MKQEEYIKKSRIIQDTLITFLEDETDSDENYNNLLSVLNGLKNQNYKYELLSFLHLLSKIIDNHYRGLNFFSKIEKILRELGNDIKSFFSNLVIFHIFKKNKRILLFLLEEKMLIMEEYIVKKFFTDKYYMAKYPQYFLPEIKPFLENLKTIDHDYKIRISWIKQIEELPDNEKRKIGENDGYICQLIQNDSIKEFIIYINKNNISLNSSIESSIYETH